MPDQFTTAELNPLTELELDPENPRLPRELKGATQTELLEIMISRFDVSSLAESIVSAGFLEFDPIAGFKTDSGRIRIREGNRRVAAAKMLLDPSLVPPRYSRMWHEMADRLRDETKAALGSLQVQVWNDPESIELNAYIGYRHVTGVRPWPPVEKARFIAYLIETESLSYRQTADRIGSKPRHVERHFVAYRMVEQALNNEVPGADHMEDAFGVLLRSLQAKGIPEFLGIEYTGDPADAMEPVAPDHEQEFREFVRWTFGTDERPKVLRDSRDITKWARILSSDSSLSYLRRNPEPDFNRAWERSGGESQTLAELILVAADNLREAVPIVPDHANEDDVMAAAAECSRFFVRMIRSFPDLAAELRRSL
jgi:hypothetical protein